MRRAGFTLVELLVVISILTALAALMFPAFHRSREQARATVCQANVRQLVTSLLMYDQEHQSLPYGYGGVDGSGGSGSPSKARPPGDYPGNMTVDGPGWWWFNYIGAIHYKTFRDMNALRCPSRQIEGTRLALDIRCGNYGVNSALCKNTVKANGEPSNEFEGTPLSLAGLRHSESTLLMMDSGYALINWWHVAKDPPVTFGGSIRDTAYIPGLVEVNKERLLWPEQKWDAFDGRHPNRTVNVAYANGNIERKKADDLLVPKTEEGDWHYKPLWSPE